MPKERETTSMSKLPVGIVVAGCGVTAGSDPYEVAWVTYHLEKHTLPWQFLAPQHSISETSQRELLAKASSSWIGAQQITRGKVLALEQIEARQLSAIIVPGGPGILTILAKMPSDSEIEIHNEFKNLVRNLYRRKKPIGGIGAGGLLISAALFHPQEHTPTITLGKDARWIALLEARGGIHVPVRSDEVVIDEKNRIVTTPGFAADDSLQMVERGIGNLVKVLQQFLTEPARGSEPDLASQRTSKGVGAGGSAMLYTG